MFCCVRLNLQVVLVSGAVLVSPLAVLINRELRWIVRESFALPWRKLVPSR